VTARATVLCKKSSVPPLRLKAEIVPLEFGIAVPNSRFQVPTVPACSVDSVSPNDWPVGPNERPPHPLPGASLRCAPGWANQGPSAQVILALLPRIDQWAARPMGARWVLGTNPS
jgi:hypothetical protein